MSERGAMNSGGLFIGPENAFSGDIPLDSSTHYLISYKTIPEKVPEVYAMLGSHPEFSAIKIGINTAGQMIPEGQMLMSLIIPHEINMPEFFEALTEVFDSETV